MRSQRRLVNPKAKKTNYLGLSLSLHQLNPEQTDALTLRRLSDGATEVIGFSNSFLNTVQAESFLNGSAGTVVRWNEYFGNDLVSVSQNREPSLYDTNGIITVNGTPSIKFFSSYMESVNVIDFPTYWSSYIVCRQNASGIKILVNIDHNINGYRRISQLVRDRYHSLDILAGTRKVIQNPDGLVFLRTERRKSDTTYNLRINQYEDTNPSNGFNNGTQYLWLGAFVNQHHGDGYISEIQFLFDSEEEDTLKRDEIKSRYNFTF